ncbi:MAG: NifB/NifX family molybdenum-iron cluster-binding protein [Lachnospiraceae bacterium]|nr:NifB/NifX family molybdenum-iron cluster-binding protein [Lachnospiraceae bacterium]
MRIAVAYDNGMIFQHFGHTESFKIYDVTDGQLVNEMVIYTNGQGHDALASFLVKGKIEVLICGGIGPNAQDLLTQSGIRIFAGVSGNADDAVKALLNGTLTFSPCASCGHHGHGKNGCDSECGMGCGR